MLLDEVFEPNLNEVKHDPTINVIGRPLPFKPELMPAVSLTNLIKYEEPKIRLQVNSYGNEYPPSVLSIVADSAEVEVLIVDKLQLSLVADSVANLLTSRLKNLISAERPFPESLLADIKQDMDQGYAQR